MRMWGQNIQNFFFYLGKHSGCHYCCSLCHDITAVPARLRPTVRHLPTMNSTLYFLFVNMLALAEPLMLNHFSVSARINITDPGNWMNGNCYTHTYKGKREKQALQSQAKLTEINEQTVRTGRKSGERSAIMRTGLHFSWCSIQRSPWMHFSFHTCIICVPVLSNIVVVKLQVK